jgi:sarcosine oxidase
MTGLLTVPVALRAKSEVYVMAELDDQQAADLDAMPCINRTISHPPLADLYVLPPIRYPDGRAYLKAGANTMADRWLPDPAAVRAWYDHDDDDGPLSAHLALTGRWQPGLPRDAFGHIPAHGPWNGMTLLRDKAG